MNLTRILLLIGFVLSASFSQSQSDIKITSGMLGAMEARAIGPAVMGGRITSIDAVESEPRTIYVGTAGGGVWKSTTGGTIFTSIFDKYTQSIGWLAIDQAHPDTVWVGTGESNMRNSVSIGTGLYKTTDGGNNWTMVGLDSTEHIAKIQIHPTNKNVVYVAAPGPLWSDSKHRGLYKTSDGGKTWEKILYVDEKTGCADVVVNPQNPDILYASMWQFRRTGYSFDSGGKGSALYKSIDGGKTWKKLQNGLPKEEYGRIALALAPSEPTNLFAIVESKNTGLYLSTDAGENWKQQSTTTNVASRPFYFSLIMVDPKDAKRVYRPAFQFSMSDDGGLSFTEASMAGGWVHSDHHALWINPSNTSHILLGTDGGVYMSMDKGNNWLFLNNLPVSQFYHVSVDMQYPYNVYGGLQDNGSWTAPSQSKGGIEEGDWQNVGHGDGFWVVPDLLDKDIVYSEYQGGTMSRVNRKTNESQNIQPQALFGEAKQRFNWNTPIVQSPGNKSKIYTGSQHLYKTYNKGQTWIRIATDLTTNDLTKQQQENSGGVTVDNSSAENHCTIFSICESPKDSNIIWVGTDDGNLQLTTNGGKDWLKVNQNNKDLPSQTWVSSIEASGFDANTVYVTFDNHTRGDMNTYLYKSTDLGKTWQKLSSPDFKGYAHKIKEDILNSNLLFLGTELGLYVTFDAGKNWTQMTAKLPNCAYRDIVIHPTTNDLVLGTHGRGVLIVDDISPLRQLTQEVLKAECVIFNTRSAVVTNGHFEGGWPSAGGFVGPNSSEEASIVYYLKDRATVGDLKIEIYDKNNQLLNTVVGTKRKGINRVTWAMRTKPPRVALGASFDFAGFFAPLAEPGTYTVKILKGDKTFAGSLELVSDPISVHSLVDMDLQRKTLKEIFQLEEELALLVQQLVNMRDSANAYALQSKDPLKKSLTQYAIKLEDLRKTLVATKESKGITGEERLRENLSMLYYNVISYEGKPTDSQLNKLEVMKKELENAQQKTDVLFAKNLEDLNNQLAKANAKKLVILSKQDFDASNLNQVGSSQGGN